MLCGTKLVSNEIASAISLLTTTREFFLPSSSTIGTAPKNVQVTATNMNCYV